MTLLRLESVNALLIVPNASEFSYLDTILIDDSNTKIKSFAEKKYTLKKTWEKVTTQLNFKQLSYLIIVFASSMSMVSKWLNSEAFGSISNALPDSSLSKVNASSGG